MKFRKGLLDIYEKTLNREKEFPLQLLIKEKVRNILRSQFKNKKLNNFYLLSRNEGQIIDESIGYCNRFDFKSMISFDQKQFEYMCNKIEPALSIIGIDKDYEVSIKELSQEFEVIKHQYINKDIVKQNFVEFFKKANKVFKEFNAKQREYRGLIGDELNTDPHNNKKRKGEKIIYKGDPKEIENCFKLFNDNREITDYSNKQAKKIIIEIYTQSMNKKNRKDEEYDIIQQLLNNGEYLQAGIYLRKFFNGVDVSIGKDVIEQIKRITDIINKYETNDSIPANVSELLKLNFESFDEKIEQFLVEQNIYNIKYTYGYIVRSGFSELLNDMKEIIKLNKIFEDLKIDSIENRRIITNRLAFKKMLKERVKNWLEKTDYNISNEKLKNIGAAILKNLKEASDEYEEKEYKKITSERRKKEFVSFIIGALSNKREESGKKMKIIYSRTLSVFIGLAIIGKYILGAFMLLISLLHNALSYLPTGKQVPEWLKKRLPNSFTKNGLPLSGDGIGDYTYGEMIIDIINNIIRNGKMSGDLRNNFNERGTDIPFQINLRNNKVEEITGLHIENYDGLDNKMLVGEIFMDFRDYTWNKIEIDYTDMHIIERYNAKEQIEFPIDYSLFLDKHNWKLEEKGERKSVVITLSSKVLIKGRNSVVCPRGYLPIITEKSKELLRKNGISYRLYCLKSFGYYYIDLSKKPEFDICIEYRRYGEGSCYGIFFANDEVRTIERLTERLLNETELSEELGGFLESIINLPDEDYLEALSKYLEENFIYSKTKKTSIEHRKHKTHLGGVSMTKKGDCKNVNTLLIGLARIKGIKSRLVGGYVSNGLGKYTGHAICEINENGKCRLYDATPKNEEKETEQINKFKQIREIMSNLKGKAALYGERIGKIFKIVNFQKLIDKLEEKRTKLLAKKVLIKKRQIELSINKDNYIENYKKIILSDLMMLESPTELYGELTGTKYVQFLRKYYEILCNIEKELTEEGKDDNYKELNKRIKTKLWRKNAINKIATIIGLNLTYEDFMYEYYKSYGVKNENGEIIKKEENKQVIFDIIIESFLIKKGVKKEKVTEYQELVNIYFGKWKEKLCEYLLDIEQLNNSNFADYVYLPCFDFNNSYDMKESRLIEQSKMSSTLKLKGQLNESLDIIYRTIENNSVLNDNRKINKQNYLMLLAQAISEIKSYTYIEEDSAKKIIRLVDEKNKEFNHGEIIGIESSILSINRLTILININYYITKDIRNLSGSNFVKTLTKEDFNYNEYIKNCISNSALRLQKYIDKYGEDSFINKILLMLSTGLNNKKYDYYLSQKSFVDEPTNILLIIRIITQEIKIAEKRINAIKIDQRGGYFDFKYNNYFDEIGSRNKILEINEAEIIKKELIEIKKKLKSSITGQYLLNSELMVSVLEATGIENSEDMQLIQNCLDNLLQTSINLNVIESIINILIDYHINNNMNYQRHYFVGNINYLRGGAVNNEFTVDNMLSSIPGEVLSKIAEQLLKDEKKIQKDRMKSENTKIESSEYYLRQTENNKKIERFSLLIKAIRRAKFNSGAQKMISNNLLIRLERIIYTLEMGQLENLNRY